MAFIVFRKISILRAVALFGGQTTRFVALRVDRRTKRYPKIFKICRLCKTAYDVNLMM